MNYRLVNLELGLPAVRDAMQHLTREIQLAKRHKIAAVKVIHGFGSSGRGGKIRLAARRELDMLQKRGYIKYYILGEKFSIFEEETRSALRHCDALRKDSDLERHNNGITIVIL